MCGRWYCARVSGIHYFDFFFKQKTAYEMRISDWSSDVCSSDPSHPADIERLCRLLDSGRVWIKTSLTRITRRPGDYLDLSGIAAKLASNFPEQCVWGRDWPHVQIGRASCRERVCKYV